MTDGLVAPAVIRRRLGAKLKDLRGQAGLSLETVARVLEFSTAKLSRLETGQVSPKTRDVRDLLELYNVVSDLRKEIMGWAEEAKHPGWWQPLPPTNIPVDLDLYISLEAEAASISQSSTSVVPGLLQTHAYAEALLADIFRSAPDEAITKLVNIRIERQKVLANDRVGAPPLALHVVLDEAALYRRPRADGQQVDADASRGVLREQLEHLVAVAEWPNITLQVFRFEDGFTDARSVMTIFRPRETSDWPVVNIEGAGHDPFYSDEEDIEMFERIWRELISSARDETASRQLIEARVDALTAVSASNGSCAATSVPDDPDQQEPA